MQIKEFASKYKLTNDTVRYYEKEGLISPVRLENGYRMYDELCEKKIKYALVFKQLGFSLKEIVMLLELEGRPLSPDCNKVSVSLFDDKITSIERKIRFFASAIQTLKLANDLMAEGKYAENRDKIELLIEEMYLEMKEGIK